MSISEENGGVSTGIGGATALPCHKCKKPVEYHDLVIFSEHYVGRHSNAHNSVPSPPICRPCFAKQIENARSTGGTEAERRAVGWCDRCPFASRSLEYHWGNAHEGPDYICWRCMKRAYPLGKVKNPIRVTNLQYAANNVTSVGTYTSQNANLPLTEENRDLYPFGWTENANLPLTEENRDLYLFG